MKPSTTIVLSTDAGSVMWEPTTDPSALDPSRHDASDVIDGGFLLATPALVEDVRSVLDEKDMFAAFVAEPSATYAFTEGRDTYLDVVAAMCVVADGRGMFNLAGRQAIATMLAGDGPAIVELTDEEAEDFDPDDDDDTIYVVGPVIY